MPRRCRKIYGNDPKKLLNKIIINNDTNIIKLDFKYFSKILNSLNKKLNLISHTINDRDFKTHKGRGIRVSHQRDSYVIQNVWSILNYSFKYYYPTATLLEGKGVSDAMNHTYTCTYKRAYIQAWIMSPDRCCNIEEIARLTRQIRKTSKHFPGCCTYRPGIVPWLESSYILRHELLCYLRGEVTASESIHDGLVTNGFRKRFLARVPYKVRRSSQ